MTGRGPRLSAQPACGDGTARVIAVARGALLCEAFEAYTALMGESHRLGGPVPDRPWAEPGYGLGLMCGLDRTGSRVAGHTGQLGKAWPAKRKPRACWRGWPYGDRAARLADR